MMEKTIMKMSQANRLKMTKAMMEKMALVNRQKMSKKTMKMKGQFANDTRRMDEPASWRKRARCAPSASDGTGLVVSPRPEKLCATFVQSTPRPRSKISLRM